MMPVCDRRAIETRQQTVAKSHGFHITDHSLVLYGKCADCQRYASGGVLT